jgi:hypothetical protein
MVAVYTDGEVTIDGALDDPVWQKAPKYPLQLSMDKQQEGQTLAEGGTAQVAWDDRYIYVAVDFTDTDVIAQGKEDQLHHYRMGDLAEVFIKPADNSWYWELYVTPGNNKTSFFFPSRGYLGLPGCFDEPSINGLAVAARVDGTLNNWLDKDTGWTGEMRIPVEELSAAGVPFSTSQPWTIMIARYNYGVNLEEKILSSTAEMPYRFFHLHETFSPLEFRK